MVHITKQTKDLLTHHYNISPSDAGRKDPELSKRQIECFLISPEVRSCEIQYWISEIESFSFIQPSHFEEEASDGTSNGVATDISDGISLDPTYLVDHYTPNGTVNGRRDGKLFSPNRRPSLIPIPKKISVKTQPRFTRNTVSRRTPFMDNNLDAYSRTLAETGKRVQQAVHDMPLSKSE